METVILFLTLFIIQFFKISLTSYTLSLNGRLISVLWYPFKVLQLSKFRRHVSQFLTNIWNFFFTSFTTTLLFSFARLIKSPYADAYWFLYSTKLTYTTNRSLYLN